MEEEKIPRCVGIIMDGNRRWERTRAGAKGHHVGYEVFKDCVRWAERAGVQTLIVYAFALKNWRRAESEVAELMQLFEHALANAEDEFAGENVRLRFIGNRALLPESIVSVMRRLEDETRHRNGLQLVLAISYGGRDEIVRTTQCLAEKAVREGGITITEDMFAAYLDTAIDIPDPDLIIRTGGELRCSDFLTWQAVDAEWYPTSVLWPNFTEAEFRAALAEYTRRDRRFGR